MPATRRSLPREIIRDFRAVLQRIGRLTRHRWPAALAILTLASAAAWIFVHPYDDVWRNALRGDERHFEQAVHLGQAGDFIRFNLGFAAILWTTGLLARNRYLRRLAVTSLVAGIVAGLSCDAVRMLGGRPRPKTRVAHPEVVDRFTGPSLKSAYQSFPSGHTSACFGSATPVLAALPAVGLPVTAAATAVGWSRIYGNYHNPSDVLVGMVLGSLAGLPAGLQLRAAAARAARIRAASRKSPPSGGNPHDA